MDQTMFKGDANNTSYFIVPVALAKGLESLKSDLVLTGLILNWSEMAKAKGSRYGEILRVPKFGTKSARTKVPGTAFDTTKVTNDKAELPINKHKFWDIIVEDYGSLFAQEGLMDGYVKEGKAALAEAIEADVIGLYASLSNSVGTPNGGLTDLLLIAIRKKSRQLKFRMTNPTYLIYGVTGEEDLLAINKQVLVNESGSSQALINARFGTRYGMQFYTSNLMPSIVGSPSAEHGLCFQSEAFGIAFVDMAQFGNYIGVNALQYGTVYNDDNGKPSYSMRVKVTDEHRHFGTLFTVDTIYGVAVMQDPLAIDVLI